MNYIIEEILSKETIEKLIYCKEMNYVTEDYWQHVVDNQTTIRKGINSILKNKNNMLEIENEIYIRLVKKMMNRNKLFEGGYLYRVTQNCVKDYLRIKTDIPKDPHVLQNVFLHNYGKREGKRKTEEVEV